MLAKQCGASGAQIVALGFGVDRQRHRRIVTVPGRDEMHWHAAGQHQADAGIAKTLEMYTAFGMWSSPIEKWISDRCVCAPQ